MTINLWELQNNLWAENMQQVVKKKSHKAVLTI